MLLEFLLGLIPATIAVVGGGTMLLGYLIPMFLLGIWEEIAGFLSGSGSMDLRALNAGYPILLTAAGAYGLTCLWRLFLARLRGSSKPIPLRQMTSGIWMGVVASTAFCIAYANPGKGWNWSEPVLWQWFLVADLAALRLWWVLRSQAVLHAIDGQPTTSPLPS